MSDEEFTLAVRRYMDTVYRVALNALRHPEDAQDVTQEVFLRLYRSGTKFQSEDHLKAWLIRVTINECRRSLAAPWRSRTEPLSEATRSPSCPTEENDTLRIVMTLPAKYKLVLYLFYYEGYTTKEIAQLLRVSASTVRTRMERGRNLLKQQLLEADHV